MNSLRRREESYNAVSTKALWEHEVLRGQTAPKAAVFAMLIRNVSCLSPLRKQISLWIISCLDHGELSASKLIVINSFIVVTY